MEQTLELFIHGRYIEQNPFSEVPRGALLVASNMVVDRESIGESRRGFKQYGTIVGDINQYLNFNDTLLEHHDNDTLARDSDNFGTWVDYTGTFAAPSTDLKIQGVELNKSFYFTSAVGIYRLDSVTGTPRRSGVTRALDGSGSLTGASGFLADNSAVAYRILWGYRDANNQLLLGSPSARITVSNSSGGTRNVILNFTVPADIDTTYFYQIYRSEQAVSATDTPSDELQLVVEKPITAGEVTAGVVNYTDILTDDLRGAFIYTAPSQQGILLSNDRPPLAIDLTKFRQHIFYGNTKQPYRLSLSLITNVVANDTIVIAGTTYTAKAIENIAANEFLVGATIAETVRSFIRVVNRSASNTAIQLVELDEKTFLAETIALPGSNFTVNSSASTKFSKTLPLNSDNEAKINRVHIAKPNQGDAAPLLAFFDVGSGNKALKRIIASRDAVFVIKEDGVFRINGTDINNFIVEPHDETTKIKGPNTARLLDNRIFMMSDKGACVISVTGVDDTIGRDIERELLELSAMSNFEALAYGINYDSDRKYILAVPMDSADTATTQMHVYNYFTKAWTTWEFESTAAVVSERDNKLYIGRATDNQTLQERKAFIIDDYADDEYTVTIASSTSDTVTVSSLPGNVTVGMTLRQALAESVITEINSLTLTLETPDQPWTNAAATIYTPIPVAIQWIKNAMGNPGILKHASELSILSEDARFSTLNALFSTNFMEGFINVPLAAIGQGNWGDAPWGDEEWGGFVGGDQPIRTYFPKGTNRAHWFDLRLELNQAFNALDISGASIIYQPMSPRFR